MNKKLLVILLYTIVIFSGFLRLYMVNWDGGYHMHPDERAITLSVIDLVFPTSFADFLSPDSLWNPKFFAYGSLPFYLLALAGNMAALIDPLYAAYDGINIVGRYLSAFFDLGTLILIFLIARRLMSQTFALLAAFFYGMSVLPIQLSHFYAVDTLLTFFITGTLYFLLRWVDHQSVKDSVGIGLFFGAALATKISASVLLVPIGLTLAVAYVPTLLRTPHKPLQSLPRFLTRTTQSLLLLVSVTLITFIFFEPYALLDFPTFLRQTLEQSQMTKSAFTFPYTLQYVGKVSYIYELKNIILYGLGPLLAFLSIAGILLFSQQVLTKEKKDTWAKELILVVFFWVYFLLVGNFAIGFMRYMLPLYPLFALSAAYFLFHATELFPSVKRKSLGITVLCVLLLLTLIWPFSFLRVYSHENTRIQASEYIHRMIPSGSVLAIEHWDDGLPLTEQGRYGIVTLNLYDPDTPEKWHLIREHLDETDYIILASNRLYTPLMRLTNCEKLPSDRCYKLTSEYYHRLFNGSLGFTKVAEFTSYPTIPFTDIELNDQGADESFTVYDHPKVMIFKKNN
jgi:4-amino-4-deoxy-L-arabinose transferase-like glycosyltransferase